MIEILEYLEKAAVFISLFAVAVIFVGFTVSVWRYALRFNDTDRKDNFNSFKVELGKILILCLEILILADVIETITVTPTFKSLAVLATIVIVRTIVSWTLTLEVEGRWPWQAERRVNTMPDYITHGLELLIQLLEICGAGMLILGFVVATWVWARQTLQQGYAVAFGAYRQSLGRSVLIGLEVLVAATIIKTIIIEPSIESLGVIVIMIAIRTILGWTTALEIQGKWPWQ